ncbi:MAG: ATP-binding cassette domain-containing protein [Candidatus Izemoplasmatales bacterium]|jgi:sodium transport system ATP-binding protein|nr:ATP-binding cassette domain-containing protein [Candidatus Izemoplasmatales bacterium]
MKASIIVNDISKTFHLSKKQQRIEKSDSKVKVAVDGLSFEAYEGEIYGLLGPNGAGKTTTLRCISTLIKPDSGDITIHENSVIKNENEVRKMIGFLTSDLKLEDFFTPNYLFEYFANLHGINQETMIARKEYLFDKFKIDKFAEVKIGDLSTGMRQKVQIAISLVHDPKVIIFDEPTNGLDVITAKVVTDYLIDLKNMGKTIIISTHIFSLVEKICDRVGIIINGKIVLNDYLSNLVKKNGDLEELFFDLYKKESGEVE